MTRKIIKGMTAVTIVLTVMIIYIMLTSSIKAWNKNQGNDYKYHFQVIVDKNTNNKLSENLEKSINEEANRDNVYVEIVRSADSTSMIECLDKAIYSKVDGVAYCTNNSSSEQDILKRAKKGNIPVVNYGYNSQIKYVSNIGFKAEELGRKLATRMKKGLRDKDKVLVLLQDSDDFDKVNHSKFVKGFKKGISSKSKDKIKVENIPASNHDTNSKIKTLIKKHDSYKNIVCLEYDILNILNEVVNDSHKIYFLDSDAKIMGHNIVKSLINLKQGKNINKIQYEPNINIVTD